MTASSLLKIDDDGNVIAAPDSCELGVNRAGYVIHSAVHMARSDVNCVIHTHTRAGSAVSTMRQGLLPISQTALRFVGAMGYHDFEGPATDTSERERLVADLGAYNALVLRNHGLLVCGRTIAEAFVLMHRLEAACRIQVDAMASGDDILIPGAAAQARTAALFSQNYKGNDIAKAGTLEWKALMRMLDRQDSSFRD
jgi:ribulose-5-phosphate 4-epimerase/fuculose-1-phosphate aldolase